MPDWQMQTITDETMPRLPESKYPRMGGWLLFLVIWMAVQCANGLATCLVLLTQSLSHANSPLYRLNVHFALRLTLVILLGVTLLLLLRRKRVFIIPFAVYALFQIIFAIAHMVESPVWAVAVYALVAPLFAAWIVYFFTSDRVRVYCNKRPKRPVPMPVPEEATGEA